MVFSGILTLPINWMTSFLRAKSVKETERRMKTWNKASPVPLEPEDYEDSTVANLDVLIKRGQPVTIGYDSTDDEMKPRKVIPQKLFRMGKHIYIDALCLEERGERIFRVDKISLIMVGNGNGYSI